MITLSEISALALPVRVTSCVPALSTMVTCAFSEALLCVGVKVTEIVQVPLTATPVPHVLVWL